MYAGTRRTKGDEAMTPDFGPRMEEVLRRLNHAKRVSRATARGLGRVMGLHGPSVGLLLRGRQRLSLLHLFQIAYATGFDPCWLACCDLDMIRGEVPAEDGRLVTDPRRSGETREDKERRETA